MKTYLKIASMAIVISAFFVPVFITEDGFSLSEIKKKEITLLFTGDMMFDRGVRRTINTKGFDTVFGDAKKIFADADLVVANLEGPITSSPSKILLPDGSMTEELNFTFPVGTATALKEHGVDIVNLANNHTANQGTNGLTQTKTYLEKAGVGFFGHPGNISSELSTTTCSQGFCITLIGWHEFAHTPASDISAEIERVRKSSDIVVVLPHWGVEYEEQPTSDSRRIARMWIDAGADMVIGTHPHVIQSIEEYKGKVIFYSLGNFIFDQYFSFETTHGLAVMVTATKKTDTALTYSYKLLPTRNVGTVVSIPGATTSSNILKKLGEISTPYITSFTPNNIAKGSFLLIK